MKKKMIVAAIAAAGVAAYFIRKKRAAGKGENTENGPGRKIHKHLTKAFSRAKSFVNGQPAVQS
jgi:hypothetical protein